MVRGIVELEAAKGAAVDGISCGRRTGCCVQSVVECGEEGLIVCYAAGIAGDEDDVMRLSFCG